MATKRYNQENFYIEFPDGRVLAFYCWTTNTRNGFCHTCWCSDTDQTTKSSYTNRTWECYRYQYVLRNAFEKLPKADREVCELWDMMKEKKAHEDCEAFVALFQKVYDATPQVVKDKLAESDIHIETMEQANSVMELMRFATVMDKIK